MLQHIMSEIIEGGVLPHPVSQWSELKGGTMSKLGVLGTPGMPDLYVVKVNPKELVESESQFLKLYDHIDLLPSVRYVDPEFRYFVYDYAPGGTRYVRGAKAALMRELAQRIITRYVHPEPGDSYEHVEAPAAVEETIQYARSIIGAKLPQADHELVASLAHAQTERIIGEDVFVLHGDFGVHNFLFTGNELTGVIDPIPVVGRKRYDLLYAFCSSPDDLTLPVLLQAVHESESIGKIREQELLEDTLIALYSRLASCIRHHPADLDEYLQAWSYWTALWEKHSS